MTFPATRTQTTYPGDQGLLWRIVSMLSHAVLHPPSLQPTAHCEAAVLEHSGKLSRSLLCSPRAARMNAELTDKARLMGYMGKEANELTCPPCLPLVVSTAASCSARRLESHRFPEPYQSFSHDYTLRGNHPARPAASAKALDSNDTLVPLTKTPTSPVS
jgi:hypothetical protein